MSRRRTGQRRVGRSASSGFAMNEGSSGRRFSPERRSTSLMETMPWTGKASHSIVCGRTSASARTPSSVCATMTVQNASVYLFLAAQSLPCCAWAFSSCSEQGLFSSCGGFSCCGAQALLPCTMWDPGSHTKDRTCIPCIGRQMLHDWTTREVPSLRCWEGLGAGGEGDDRG